MKHEHNTQALLLFDIMILLTYISIIITLSNRHFIKLNRNALKSDTINNNTWSSSILILDLNVDISSTKHLKSMYTVCFSKIYLPPGICFIVRCKTTANVWVKERTVIDGVRRHPAKYR